MAPEAWGDGTLVVTRLVEAFFKEFVGKHACLGKAVDAASNFEVYPAVLGVGKEVAF